MNAVDIEKYKNRLAEQQQILIDRGVRDIKFHWVESSTFEQRLVHLVELLDKIISGDFDCFEGIGDRHIEESKN